MHNLYSRELQPEDSIIRVAGVPIGGKDIIIAAGPCSVEGEEQIMETADAVKNVGASILRGGAFKPRTSPYSFQGLGEEGLLMLKRAGEKFGMPIVSELMDASAIKLFSENVDLIQIGARNAQNFSILTEVGKLSTPVLLKNGLATTIDEWLMSSEYILKEGNRNVILCYRGVRGFEQATRFSMDLAAIKIIKEKSHLPIAIDPSHAAGRRALVEPVALAAIAAGADMLEIEVHPDPNNAKSDKEQQLTFSEFENLMEKANKVAHAIGRRIYVPK